MTALKNARHERFAQELAKGTPASEAYTLSGFKANSGNAATLKAQQSISKRVSEILEREQIIEAKATERAIEKLSISKERVLGELARIGFSNIADYVNVTGEDPRIALQDVPREQLAALGEVTTDTITEGKGDAKRTVRRVKIKLLDKKGALVDLGRHLGLFKERVEITGADGGPIETSELSARELIASRLAGYAARRSEDESPSRLN